MANSVKIGSIPSDAKSKGGLNETPVQEQRSPDFSGPQTEGPDFDPSTKAYGRAEYKTKQGLIRRDR